MISIITLSYRQTFLNILEENISNTIGDCVYEIIVINNNTGKYSICTAYNEGIRQAKGKYFCFLHEDVIFKTKNWGNEFINSMNGNPRLGLIGILGSKFKSAFPTGWYNPIDNCAYHTGNILQGKDSYEEAPFRDFSPRSEILDRVVCLDGVLLFTKKEIVDRLHFDENLLKGFHGYDIDFSLQTYFSGYEIAVLKSVKLLHYSAGNANHEWERTNILISHKWSKNLPACSFKTSWITRALMELKTIYIHSAGSRIKRFITSTFKLLNFLLTKKLT